MFAQQFVALSLADAKNALIEGSRRPLAQYQRDSVLDRSFCDKPTGALYMLPGFVTSFLAVRSGLDPHRQCRITYFGSR
jgi:hypothetical protein